MKQAYLDGKDLYAVIAQMANHNNYEDNLEHDKDGNLYPEGKKRRSEAKKILLGLMYGRGIASIAEQIGGTPEEAQEILDSFYEGFPQVKIWMDKTYENAHKLGYVEDFWGRRRRLPDINLPPFEIYDKDYNKDSNFNPILGCKGLVVKQKHPLIEKYMDLITKARGNNQKEKIKKDALKEGITILDNGGYIAQAERQCVNARVQGSSASLTKLAMIKIANDPILASYDAHLIIGVHDELLIECKEEFANDAGERLSWCMITAASDNGVDIPMKCDAEVFTWWYQDQIIGDIQDEVDAKIKTGVSKEDAIQLVLQDSFGFLTESQKEAFSTEIV